MSVPSHVIGNVNIKANVRSVVELLVFDCHATTDARNSYLVITNVLVYVEKNVFLLNSAPSVPYPIYESKHLMRQC